MESIALEEVGGGERVSSGSFVIMGTRRSVTAEDSVCLLWGGGGGGGGGQEKDIIVEGK